jgi:subtilase-type serine protease
VSLGIAKGIDLAAGGGWTVRPEVRLSWSHYVLDPTPPVLAFVNGVAPIVLRDPDPGRNAAVVGVEATAWRSAGLQLFAGYVGEFRSNATAHQGRLGLRLAW